MSIQTKSQEVEQVMRDIEQGFGEGEDLLLRLNFMTRKLRTDETLRAGGQDLEGVSLRHCQHKAEGRTLGCKKTNIWAAAAERRGKTQGREFGENSAE